MGDAEVDHGKLGKTGGDNMTGDIVLCDDSAPAWERAFCAFPAEKEWRSGSRRTVDAYSRTLQRFFATLAKPPTQVTSPDVFVFTHGRWP